MELTFGIEVEYIFAFVKDPGVGWEWMNLKEESKPNWMIEPIPVNEAPYGNWKVDGSNTMQVEDQESEGSVSMSESEDDDKPSILAPIGTLRELSICTDLKSPDDYEQFKDYWSNTDDKMLPADEPPFHVQQNILKRAGLACDVNGEPGESWSLDNVSAPLVEISSVLQNTTRLLLISQHSCSGPVDQSPRQPTALSGLPP